MFRRMTAALVIASLIVACASNAAGAATPTTGSTGTVSSFGKSVFAGQPWNSVPLGSSGQSLIYIRGTDGTLYDFRSATNDISGLYESQAADVYGWTAVRQGQVQFSDTPVPVSPSGVASGGGMLSMPASETQSVLATTGTADDAASGGLMANQAFAATGEIPVTSAVSGYAWNGVQVVGAALIGYQIGTYADAGMCSLGISAECTSGSSAQGFTPNSDINTTADPGYTPSSSVNATSCSGSAIVESWGSGAGNSINTTGASTLQMQVTYSQPPAPSLSSSCDNGSGDHIYIQAVCTSGNYNLAQTSIYGASSVSATLTANEPNGICAGLSGGNDKGACTALNIFTGADNGSSQKPAIVYYPIGSSKRPAQQTNSNPSRYFQTIDTCSDGSKTTANSAQFTETATPWPTFPAGAGCAGTATLVGIETDLDTVGGNPAPKAVYGPYSIPSGITNAEKNYPGCTAGQCVLDLFNITGSTPVDCFQHPSTCANWFADTNKSTDYQCTYGPNGNYTDAHIALSECNQYSHIFSDGSYASPVDGTGTSGKSGSGNGTKDPTSSGPAPSQPSDPTQTGGDVDANNCFANGLPTTLLDVVNYVLLPIKCALKWAFAPSAATMQQWTKYLQSLEAHPPLDIIIGGIQWISAFFTSWESPGCGTDPLCANVNDQYGFISAAASDADNSPIYQIIYRLLETGLWLTCFFGIYRVTARGFGTHS